MVFRNHLYKRMLFMVCALLLVWIPYAPGAQAAAADRLVSSPPASLGLGGGVRDYQPTSDGGYVAAGGSSVTKLDASENMQWSASISPPENVRILAVRELPMGGYIFAGEKTGRFMYGTLKANGTLNHMTLSPHPIGEATSIVKVGNDGFVIAGHVRTNLGDPLDPFLMRTDVSGVLLGEKVISIPGDQRVDSAIAAAGTDTDVILAGSTSENASHEGYMAEVTGSADNFGSVVWAKNYGADSTSYYSLSSVDYAKDEAGQPGYVATGNVVKRSGVQNALLLFTELDGKEKWLQTYQASPQLGLDVAQAKDGGFAIAGGNNNTAGFLYKTDANGNLQWQKEWPNTGNLLDVMPMDDGIYQLAGGISDGITFQTWVGPPAGLVADDDANRIIGLDESMEYSTDGGNRYEAYTGQDPVFDGEVSVLVRYKADPAGGYEAGKTATFIFTANPSQPGLPPGYTYSQDGFGFSGAVEAEPLGDRIVMTGYNDWPSDFSKQDYAFAGGVFDGQNIWMVPAKADRVIKLDTANGRMTGYDDWPSDFSLDSGQSLGAFRGGVYDGESIWMIPYDADQLIKLDKHTGEMTGYHSWPAGFSKQSHAFSGGVDDGKNIWMIPQNADRVIKVDKSTGSMTGFNAWPAGFTKSYAAFSGGVYDGRNIWMIPVLATPKAPGTAVITVTTADGNKTASCKVTVEAKERPFKIETSDKEILVGPNRMVSFRSFVVYPNGKRKEITWSRDAEYSSSSSLLTVKNGRIKAGKKEGEAFVTISYQGEERKIPVQITKTLVKSLSVPSKTVKLKKGEGQQLELTANLTDKQMKDVTERAVWTSSNEKIAKVSDTGEVTAIGVGSTWIRANYGGSQLSVRLIVTKDKPDLKKLTASSRTLRIGEGDSEQVTLTAVFEDGSEKDVTTDADWTSDDSRIAEVAEGTITGITAGPTTVTASYEKKKVTVKVTVLAAKTTE